MALNKGARKKKWKKLEVLGVIPARMGSSRFPGKPLKLINGKPMIWHVWQRALLSGVLDDLVIATCDKEIKEAAESFGAKPVMTSAKHTRANDRVAEVASKIPCKIILNIQGDEPTLNPQLIRDVVKHIRRNPQIQCVNPVAVIETKEERETPHDIKVCFDLNGRVVYFSRCPVPSDSVVKREYPCYRQVPILAFRSAFCQKLARLKAGPLELQEGTDLLRAVEHNLPVHILKTKYQTKGVDIPRDIPEIEKRLETDPIYQRYRFK